MGYPTRWPLMALVACAGLTFEAARADIVDIAWDAQGRFERSLGVVPGKFAEVCGKVVRGQSIGWGYEASGPLDFNIHYHEGKAVMFPARQDAASSAQGTLKVERAQDHCWMWTNKGTVAVTLQLRLSR